MNEHKYRKPFAILISIVSIPFIIISMLLGIHGGSNDFSLFMFFGTPFITWSLVLAEIENYIYFLIPIMMLLIGSLYLFNF